MEYIPLEKTPHYADCATLAHGLGYSLVELRIGHTQSAYQVRAVITGNNPGENAIGINDCSRLHRLLLPRLEALFNSQEVYMEVTSPGTERNIKNPAEFPLFYGRYARLWDMDIKDWVSGKILSADTGSVTLETEQGVQMFPFERIAKAKLLST